MTLWTAEPPTIEADALPWEREPVRRPYRTCVRCGSHWGGYLIAYAGWLCESCMYEATAEAGQRIREWIAAHRETEDKGNG